METVNQRANTPAPSSYADFDLATDALNAYARGSAGGTYTVQAGDTLSGIAASL